MSNIIQLPLSDGSYLDVNTDSGAIVRSSSSRVGQPRVITQTVSNPNVLPAAATIKAVLSANANNLAANAVDCTGPCLAQTLDGQLAFLPEGADDRGETQGWLILSTTAIGDAHEGNQNNPHKVTATQVGLSNVDNTSDAAKDISILTLAALGDKADKTALDTHVASKLNPHAVTATQVGLGNVDNTSDAAKDISILTLAALGDKADKTALDTHVASKLNPHTVTATQVGLGNVDNTSDKNKIISDATLAALNDKLDTVDGVKEGAALNANADNLDGNTIPVVGPAFARTVDGYLAFLPAGGAYQGVNHKWEVIGKQSEIIEHLAHIDSELNPHEVTAAQVGLGNVDNTSDAAKDISILTLAALEGKLDISAGVKQGATLNANADNLDGNTIPVVGPAFARTVDGYLAFLPAGGAYQGVNHKWEVIGKQSEIIEHLAHINSELNPHKVTKAQVGLGNVDNTSDKNKIISDATLAALAEKAAITSLGTAAVADTGDFATAAVGVASTAHIASKLNPHTVTATQVGLGNVDNTSDKNKIISDATKAALAEKAAITSLGTAAVADTGDFATAAVGTASTAHIANEQNPHAVTATQVGLGNVNNTSDAAKPISALTLAALEGKLDISAGVKEGATLNANADNLDGNTIPVVGPAFARTGDGYLAFLPAGGAYQGTNHEWEVLGNATDIIDHIAITTGNPHAVTKADIGLGNVNDTSDDAKPISALTLAALAEKATITSLGTAAAADTGDFATAAVGVASTAHIASKLNPHEVTKAQVGLGNVNDTSDDAKPISALTQAALAEKAAITSLGTAAAADTGDFTAAAVGTASTAHIANLANPHAVTATQVGLGNVDNTSDEDKATSGPIYDAIRAVVPADNFVTGPALSLDALSDNLGNNTIVATGPAIAVTQDGFLTFLPFGAAYRGQNHGWLTFPTSSELELHLANLSNPHAVTAAQVGLGNVDNTSDEDKATSGPIYQAIQDAAGGAGGGVFSEVGFGAVLTGLDGANNDNATLNPNTGVNAFIVGTGNYGNTGYDAVIGGDGNYGNTGDANVIMGYGNHSNGGGVNFIHGDGNHSNNTYATAFFGENHTSSDNLNYSLVAGNHNDTNAGDYNFIAGNYNNSNDGDWNHISGSYNHSNTGDYNLIHGNSIYSNTTGSQNLYVGNSHSYNVGSRNAYFGQYHEYCQADDSLIAGDSHVNLAGGDASLLTGSECVNNLYGARVHSAGSITSGGDAQTVELVMRRQTTNGTATELFLNGTSSRAVVPFATAWMFDIQLAASVAGMTDVKGFHRRGMIASSSSSGVVTCDIATDTFTNVAHGLNVNDEIQFFLAQGRLPAPLLRNVSYYVKTVPDANTFTIKASLGSSLTIDMTTTVTCSFVRRSTLLLSAIETVGTDLEIGTALNGATVAITADATNKSLKIGITGVASTSINWVGSVKLTSVTNP
jgi:hypothetical protein